MKKKRSNPHAFDQIKLREDVKQKIIDRFSAHQIDAHHRVDTLVKLIFVLSSGALTVSIGVFLRQGAPKLDPRIIEILQYSWYLLYVSLAAAALVLFFMVAHGYCVGHLWTKAQKTGENKIDKSVFLKVLRIGTWLFGILGFISFMAGLAMLAVVSAKAIKPSANNTLSAPAILVHRAHYAPTRNVRYAKLIKIT